NPDGTLDLVRLTANGALDTTYGGGTGVVRASLGLISNLYAVAFQPDGKIVTAGYSHQQVFGTYPNAQTLALRRSNADGSLDTTFAAGAGTEVVFLPSSPGVTRGGDPNEVALQADGKIVVGGTFWTATDQPDGTHTVTRSSAVVRCNSDG